MNQIRDLWSENSKTEVRNKVYLFDHSNRTLMGGFPVYIGEEDENGDPIPDSLTELSPVASQALIDHSPDGFNWGYGGSGSAQCALGILLDATGDSNIAMRWYQRFKEEVIAHIPTDKKIQMSLTKVKEWLEDKQSK
ncbi:hypothetical protein J5I95_15865 [Candidatus Poribacteria bacterium]|nr:hypothetical protein [Candidatus Poribacteria bacterium]